MQFAIAARLAEFGDVTIGPSAAFMEMSIRMFYQFEQLLRALGTVVSHHQHRAVLHRVGMLLDERLQNRNGFRERFRSRNHPANWFWAPSSSTPSR